METRNRLAEHVNAIISIGKERANASGKPYKGDDGVYGKAYEITIRELIQPRSKRNGKVTPMGAAYGDMRLGNRCKVEIKSACGEIGKDGEILPKADLVIYCPDVESTTEELHHISYVFEREDFIRMLMDYPGRGNMIRTKTATAGGERISIQSFYTESRQSASKKMARYLWDECMQRPTVAEFFGIE